jgi:hypothetical protein
MGDGTSNRRVFRFSLRAMLIVVAIAGLVFAWVHSAREQRQVADALRRSNPSARVLYDERVADDGELQTSAPSGPAWLRDRLGVDYVSSVAGADMFYATDDDLAHLERLPNLRRLYLERAVDVTDAGLEHLLALKRLKFLVLDDAEQVSDEGLRTLARLKSLAVLHLDLGRRMTPAGIEHLKRSLPHCRIEIHLPDQRDPVLAGLVGGYHGERS